MDLVADIVIPLILSHIFSFMCGYAFCWITIWGKKKRKEDQEMQEPHDYR